MNSRKQIQDELISLESSLPLAQDSMYAVPEGYFEGLADAVLARIKSAEADEASPLLDSIPKAMPYTVPTGYFEENLQALPGLQTQTGSEEFLLSIGKEVPYQIPTGYFENLPAAMLAQVAKPQAHVVPLFDRTWMRVATAAVVTGALVFGGIQLWSGPANSDDVAAHSNLHPDSSLQVAQAKPVIQQEIKKVSTKDLEQFIETIPVPTASANAPTGTVKTKAEELLKDVSVNEMESFLSALPGSDDEVTATD